MVQIRSKLIELFIGNLSNAVVHKLLERAVSKEFIADKYRKELLTSFNIAKRYREKINPVDRVLSVDDANGIRNKIIARVRTELMIRISKGYSGIELSLVEEYPDNMLKELVI